MPGNRSESRLVVLSNRLPVTVKRGRLGLVVERSSGGLVAAMDPVMRSRGGTWVGWPGAQLGPKEQLSLPGEAVKLVPVPLGPTEVRRYYHGFSNRTLWPLFHSLPERAGFYPKDWEAYEEVNERFAQVALAASGEEDLVWIHDYHLLRAPLHLRRLRPNARIAFFLHIPFPPYDLYRILPWYREILVGALAADLVGFHCPGYVDNFLDCADRLVGARVDRESGRVEHGDRALRVAAFPLGIDYDAFEERAIRAPRGPERRREQIVLGVDRLDYTKGIPERIRAFELLLESHPEHREQVALIQVAVPSRSQVTEYQALKREIDELVGRLNGRFGTSSWTPIRYLYRSISEERLAALYRDADVGLVTPLRDGMNLVAKEFVASQVHEPGVLILSRMAGAAETMHEAMRVNPYNAQSVADTLHRALMMDRDDRAARILALQLRERRNDLYSWLQDFLNAAGGPRAVIRPVSLEDIEGWLGRFAEGRRLALFLDYDGTLTPIADHPSKARLAKNVRAFLARCAEREDTDVTIVSGRALEDIREIVGLPSLTYAGNHGLEIAGPGLKPFAHPDLAHYRERNRGLVRSLGKIRAAGVWVEEKGASLTVHFRQAEPGRQEGIAEEARRRISELGFQPRDAHCAVEARPPIGWDKGHAVLHVLRAIHGPGWSESLRPVYLGDDDTDEDAFRALQGLGVSFRVGSAERATLATRRLPNVRAVHTLLRWVAERSGSD